MIRFLDGEDYNVEALRRLSQTQLSPSAEQLRQLQQRDAQTLYGQVERAVEAVNLASRNVARHLPRPAEEAREGE